MLAVVLVAECMDLLDGTVVTVAAPAVRRDLGASSTDLQWIVGGYALALAVGLITGGRLGDLLGRRRMFLVGAAGFTLASLLCAAAPTAGALIAFRLLQGVAGALMLPQGFGLLRDVFPPDQLGQAFAVFGPVLGSAALVGPILGGGLVDLDLLGTGWRLVFLVNLPLGAAALAGAALLLPRGGVRHAARLDLLGTALICAAGGMLVYPLIQGRELGWPVWAYGSMLASAVLLAAFALLQRRRQRAGRDPLVTASVFAHRGYSVGLVVVLVFFAGMIGAVLVLTLFLQLGEHFSPTHAGLTLVPWALGAAIGAGASGAALGPRFGRPVIQAGGAVSVVGWAIVIATVGTTRVTSWDLAPGLLVAGLGMGLVVAPLFDVILAAVEDRELGSASGVLNAVQQLAGAVGVAVIGTVFFSAVADGFPHGLRTALAVQLGLLAALLALSPLLPRWPRTDPAAAAPEGATMPTTEGDTEEATWRRGTAARSGAAT